MSDKFTKFLKTSAVFPRAILNYIKKEIYKIKRFNRHLFYKNQILTCFVTFSNMTKEKEVTAVMSTFFF